ncbi:hypothetical protein ACS0TY_017919 [Phlomoides rotata]
MKNMKNLTEIYLQDCRNCMRLPPFKDLPLLKILDLQNPDALEYIVEKDDNLLGVKFPSLEDFRLIFA